MSRGVAPHQLVESGFTGTVDLKAAALVVRDAALTGGHDRDRSICGDAFAERFDNAHRAERVGEHETSELFVRDVHGGLPTTVGDARVEEEEIKRARAETVAKGLNLFSHVDVDTFDLEATSGGVTEIVQRAAPGSASGRHDLGPMLYVLLSDRVTQASRRADQKNVRVHRGRTHDSTSL